VTTGTGWRAWYAFINEIVPLKFDRQGLLAMANAGPGQMGVFITYSPQPDLDGKYTVFGQVIEGMDVVEKLTPRNPAENVDLPPGDKITGITIEEK
jgi:cyclophilin family peptidyl-prolyl cis-trans isomerase